MNAATAQLSAMDFITARLLPEELPTASQAKRRERIVGELLSIMTECDDLGLDPETLVEEARRLHGEGA